MEKEFVTYGQAIVLKELGFDEPCFGYYNTTRSKQNELLFPQYAGELENWNKMTHLCSAPLKQQVFSWFRYNNYRFTIYWDLDSNKYMFDIFGNIEPKYSRYKFLFESNYKYDTYEEAESACIYKLIELAI